MEQSVFQDYDVAEAQQADIVSFASQSITSPRLEAQRAASEFQTEEPEEEEGMFTFGHKPKQSTAQSEADYIDNLDEDEINEAAEALEEEDFQLAADLLITGIDWAFEKILNWFFHKKTVKETPKQIESLTHMKKLTKKVIMKWGVKFKIEFLLIMLMFMYFYARYQDAEPLDSDKPSNDGERSSQKLTILETEPSVNGHTVKGFPKQTKAKAKPEVKSAADILNGESEEEEEKEELESSDIEVDWDKVEK